MQARARIAKARRYRGMASAVTPGRAHGLLPSVLDLLRRSPRARRNHGRSVHGRDPDAAQHVGALRNNYAINAASHVHDLGAGDGGRSGP